MPWHTDGLSSSHASPAAGYLLLSQEQCAVTTRSVSIFQVIPLQSGLQMTIKLQGGLGLDISADMDVSIWEQELKTSITTRSVGGKLLGSGDVGCLDGSALILRGVFPQPTALLLLGPALLMCASIM